ncbi:MAG: dehydrogenase, partial [Haliea sp.]|nr:dehydrogenase [Haliea sp.]
MKKRFLLPLLLLLPLGYWLASEGFFRDPVQAGEAWVMRHADKLPLAWFGGKLYDTHCAGCHDNPAMKAPTRQALGNQSREAIIVALEFGKMQPMAAHLSQQERRLIALHLTDSAEGVYDWLADASCDSPMTGGAIRLANWGLGLHNRRFVPNAAAGINRDNVDSLELAWTLALPRVTDMRSQPALIGDTLYVGDRAGMLYALDRERGCVYRHREIMAGVRSAITVAERATGTPLLVFADSLANVFALDPNSLETVWQA